MPATSIKSSKKQTNPDPVLKQLKNKSSKPVITKSTIKPSNNVSVKKFDTSKLTSRPDFQKKLLEVAEGIELDLDDLDPEMLDAWDEFDEEIRPKLIKKNWMLWAAIFSPIVLPGIVKGMRSEPTVPQPKVIIKGRQQEVIPPVEPRKIVNFTQKYFENHGLQLCKSLTETDLARLKDDLKNNWGKGPDAFAEAFKESYPVSKSRLETIYRSERHIAEYHGVMERAKRADHSYKRWETVGDERTCNICLAMDGEIVPINEKFSNGQMVPSAHPNCYSEDTEVFTENGWKLFKDINPIEKIWTLNLTSKIIELDEQVNQISYRYSGDMIHFKNKTIDCLVTPEHQMVVNKSWDFSNHPNKPFRLIPASTIATGDRIPRSGKWMGISPEYITIGKRKFLTSDFMTFMGWYISEGSICKYSENLWQIGISQQKEVYRTEIIELCQKMFPKIWIGSEAIWIPNPNDEFSEYLLKLGHSHEKYIPEELLHLNPELLKTFLLSFVKGDGSISQCNWDGHPEWKFRDVWSASTSSPKLMNNLTEIALKIGLRPNFRIQMPKPVQHQNGLYTSKYPQLCVDFGNLVYTCYDKKFSHYENYDGMVYCLEMKNNHSLYVRRNGKANWSGNCRCSATTYSTEDYEDLPDEFIRQDAAYLDEVTDFIKLNYKCPKNPDGTFNCNLDKESQSTSSKLDNNIIKEKIINGTPLTQQEKDFVRNKLISDTGSIIAKPEKEPKSVIKELKSLKSKKTTAIPENDVKVPSRSGINKIRKEIEKAGGPEAFFKTADTHAKGQDERKPIDSKQAERIIGLYTNKDTFRKPYKEENGIKWYKQDNKDTSVIIAKVGKKVAAYALKASDPDDPKNLYTTIVASTDFKGKGIGKQAMLEFYDNYPDMIKKTGGLTPMGKQAYLKTLKMIAGDNKQKQDTAYLNDVASFIKQNRKCKVGTYDDTNACGPSKEAETENKLTLQEKQVVDYYQRTGYGKMNAYLRNNETNAVLPQERAIVEGQIKLLENTISKSKLYKELKVFKGVDDRIGLYSNIDNLVGTTVTDPGFCSTSTSVDIAAQHARSGKLALKGEVLPPKGIIAVMKLPQGTEALEIGQTESEVLVQHGTSFKVTAVDKSGPYWRVDMEAIPNPKLNSLLEDVASFMKLNYKCEFNGSDWKCPETVPTDTSKEIKIDNPFEMRNKLSQYVNINEVQESYDNAAQELFDTYGSGPESDWSPEEIKRYEDDYAKIASLNKIHPEAIKEFNYNAPQINHPTRDREKKLALELKETLDAVTTKQDLVMWRGEYKKDWEELAKSGSGLTDRFTSISQSKSIAEQFKGGSTPYLVRIEMPVGTHAVPSWTENVESPNEKEWILNKDTKLEVTGRSDNILNVRVILNKEKQNELYLSDVADQLKLNYKCRKEDSPDGSNKCPNTKNDLSSKKSNIKITVPAGIVPPGTTAAEIGSKFKQPNGAPIRGTVIAVNDPKIPEVLYHFTTHGESVARDGVLRAGGVGGLGGDRRDQIVSMTTDPKIANALKNDMIFAAKYGKAVTDNPPPPREWNDQKKVWEGDRTEWFNTIVAPLLIKKADDDGFTKFDPNNDALIEPKSYGPDDHLRSYFHSRESSNRELGKETLAKFKNPLIYTDSSDLAKINPDDIKIVSIPKKNLDQGQLLTDFDLDNPSGLKEIRSYGDIPLETPVKLNEFDNRNNQTCIYLKDVADFLKLNKKCKAGTYDESNKCGPEKETNKDIIDKNLDDYKYKENKLNINNKTPVETREIESGLGHNVFWNGLPVIVKSNAPKLSPEESNLLYKYFGKEKYSHAINKASYAPNFNNKTIIENGNKIESIINRSILPINIVSFSGASDNEISELLNKSTISSFISTSMDKNVTSQFGKNQIEFRLPKGTNALIPGFELNHFSEHEVLLNRNIKFDIISDTIVSKPIEHHYVIVTPSKPPQPFQEVSSSFNTELGGFHTTDYEYVKDKSNKQYPTNYLPAGSLVEGNSYSGFVFHGTNPTSSDNIKLTGFYDTKMKNLSGVFFGTTPERGSTFEQGSMVVSQVKDLKLISYNEYNKILANKKKIYNDKLSKLPFSEAIKQPTPDFQSIVKSDLIKNGIDAIKDNDETIILINKDKLINTISYSKTDNGWKSDASSEKTLRVISQDKADNQKLLDAIKGIEQDQLPSQFLVMKMKDGIPAKYYAKTDSIGVDKSLSSDEMAKEIKKVLDSMKTNSSYLSEVSDFIKLNYRCEENPPGSGNFKCDVTKSSDKALDKINKNRLKEVKTSLKDLKAKNQSIRDQMDKVPANSQPWKELQKTLDIDKEYELDKHIKILNYKHPNVPPEFESFLVDSDNAIKSATPEEQRQINLYVAGFGNAFYQGILAKFKGKLPDNPEEYVKTIVGERYSFDKDNKFNPNDSFQVKEYNNTLESLNTQITNIKNMDAIIGRSKLQNDIVVQTGISSALFEINELKPGDEFDIPTYISTTRSDKVANGFALRKFTEDKKNYNYNTNTNKPPTIPTVLEIHMKSGSRALALENFALTSQGADAEFVIGDKGVAGTGSQQEVLLARGSKFTVKEITQTEFRGKPIRKLIVDGYN